MAAETPSNPKEDVLLSKPDPSSTHQTLTRTTTPYHPSKTFTLPKGSNKHYQQQYADMYFARLAQLKPAVEANAASAWANFSLAGETARRVDRVLDVRQGELCWVIGTCYMEMPLKPNVLDDLGKEHWIAAPPPRVNYMNGGAEDGAGGEQVMLEDESGRLRLTGEVLQTEMLVTGAIIAVVGTENKDGDFEVLDVKVPDLPRQPQRWEKEDGDAAVKGKSVSQQKRSKGGKVAIVSGLGISGDEGDTLALDLLMEWLLGEAGGSDDQEGTAGISRLIIAGNSLAHGSPIATRKEVAAAAQKNKGARKYGYDSSAYNAAPTDQLDLFLSTLLPSIPITLIPGASDPTSTQLPQQPVHAALFPHSRAYMTNPSNNTASTNKETDSEENWFSTLTNPTTFTLSGLSFLATGGQPATDIAKYLPASTTPLEILEAMLRWRLIAPTAPDTLWCYPFPERDAFVLEECPHVFVVGNQPRLEVGWVDGPRGEKVRCLALPAFRETGEVVVLDLDGGEDGQGLGVEVVRFGVFGEEKEHVKAGEVNGAVDGGEMEVEG